MTKYEGMTKSESRKQRARPFRHWVIRGSFVIRHSSFVISAESPFHIDEGGFWENRHSLSFVRGSRSLFADLPSIYRAFVEAARAIHPLSLR